jgi:rhamnose transport system permease protein
MTDPHSAPPNPRATAAGAPVAARRPLFQRASGLLRWESLLLVILALLAIEGARLSKFFLTGPNFANLVSAEMEVAIVALPMTLIIITGEIDLSVESMIGLSGAILGWLWAAGVPIEVGIPIVLVVGALGGLLNGLLVARVGLPSLVVTLGTLALFRGLANVVLGPTAVSNFPAGFTAFGFGNIPGTPVPWTLIVFAVLGVVFYLVAHRTWIGRQVFAVGKNKDAARYSGVRVGTLKAALFVLSGVIAALAGVILAARFSSARADNGTGLTLVVVTIVLLGGVDINGGKGTIPGVILAVFTLAVLQNVLRLSGVSSEYQAMAVGLLLIVSVTAPYLARQTRSFVDRARRGRHPPAGSMVPGEVVGRRLEEENVP